ncbi:MAG: LiaF transmembrane domain-containing protein [Roseburia sp.]
MKGKGKKIFWGVIFILAAVYIVVSRIFVLPEISVWSIILTIVFAAMIIKGIRELNFFEILFGIAFLCWIYDGQLGIENLTPWPVMGAALLGSIGLSMIFKRKKNTWSWSCGDSTETIGATSDSNCDGEHIRCENNFGSSIKYINSENFCNAELENNFGELTVYFDNAVIQSGSAYVNVENDFGTTNLYIPKVWKVVNNLSHSFGTIDEHGRYEGSSSNTLYLRGQTDFGTINIYYI